MRIICGKCNREIYLSEFITYIEAYLFKLIEKILVEFFVQAAKHYLLTQNRGFFDNHMAGLANNFKMKCPNCKCAGRWNPAPEVEVKKEKTKQECKKLSI